jgi:cell division inhibitor SepF
MASVWRRAMLYLGLGPDEEYDDYGYEEPPIVEPAHVNRPRPTGSAEPEPAEPLHVLRPDTGPEAAEPEEPAISAVRPMPSGGTTVGARPDLELGAVRPIPVSSAKPQVVVPSDFNDAQELADRFKASQPVIVNLQGTDRDLSRRVIDFASGLCYGLGGQMERVASQVYLLTPADVEVSDEDRRRITERGLGRR